MRLSRRLAEEDRLRATLGRRLPQRRPRELHSEGPMALREDLHR